MYICVCLYLKSQISIMHAVFSFSTVALEMRGASRIMVFILGILKERICWDPFSEMWTPPAAFCCKQKLRTGRLSEFNQKKHQFQETLVQD